jgi:hypothetical protein
MIKPQEQAQVPERRMTALRAPERRDHGAEDSLMSESSERMQQF